MKKLTYLLSSTVFSLSFFSTAFAQDRLPTIVGGVDAEAHAFPFVASLQLNGRHYCGGSLINENTILTAAHCVYGQKVENIKVSLGRHNIKNKEDSTAQTIQASDFVMHPKFSYNTLVNDVAIIHLATPAKLTEYVQPIMLADEGTTPEGETTIIGWGKLDAGWFGKLPDILQVASVDVVSFEQCVKAYSGGSTKVQTGMMCASSPGIDTCQGDSGGPLFQDGKLLGLTSWGRGCADKDYPGVYTQVSAFLDFIHENTKN